MPVNFGKWEMTNGEEVPFTPGWWWVMTWTVSTFPYTADNMVQVSSDGTKAWPKYGPNSQPLLAYCSYKSHDKDGAWLSVNLPHALRPGIDKVGKPGEYEPSRYYKIRPRHIWARMKAIVPDVPNVEMTLPEDRFHDFQAVPGVRYIEPDERAWRGMADLPDKARSTLVMMRRKDASPHSRIHSAFVGASCGLQINPGDQWIGTEGWQIYAWYDQDTGCPPFVGAAMKAGLNVASEKWWSADDHVLKSFVSGWRTYAQQEQKDVS